MRENNKRVDYDYKVGDKILIRKDGILHKAEFIWKNNHGQLTAHTNVTIRIPNLKELTSGEEHHLVKNYRSN